MWIEINADCLTKAVLPSLPVRECGLKYVEFYNYFIVFMSLPVRECGLKLLPHPAYNCVISVTPRAGVWIEISRAVKLLNANSVTPRAGVWIEICNPYNPSTLFQSLPVRECGLKSSHSDPRVTRQWCHSPCGSVD